MIAIGLGFDGSRSSDWTALRAETMAGVRFTPRYGPSKRSTFWDPKQWPEERIPRSEVNAAVAEVFATFEVVRFYVDPRHWETQADDWESRYGEDVVVQWPTNRVKRMHEALVRYQEDLAEGLTKHVPDAEMRRHALHARKVPKPGDQFILGKPEQHMKIDLLMADVLAHEAVSDARAAGWGQKKATPFFRFR